MSEQQSAVSRYATFDDLTAAVKGKWKKAEVAIANSIGSPCPIRRVAFHENADGRLVVLLYEDATPRIK